MLLGKDDFVLVQRADLISGFFFVGKMMVNLKVQAYLFAPEYNFWGFLPSSFVILGYTIPLHFFKIDFKFFCFETKS